MRSVFVALWLSLFVASQTAAQFNDAATVERAEKAFAEAEQSNLDRASPLFGEHWLETRKIVRQIIGEYEVHGRASTDTLIRFWQASLHAMIPDDADAQACQARDAFLAAAEKWSEPSGVHVTHWRSMDAYLGSLYAASEEIDRLRRLSDGGNVGHDLIYCGGIRYCAAVSMIYQQVLAIAPPADPLVGQVHAYAKLRITRHQYNASLCQWANIHTRVQRGAGASCEENVATQTVYQCKARMLSLQEQLDELTRE